jgi:hypothetical protein
MSLRWNWDSPNPYLASEWSPTPRTEGVGAHSLAGEGLGESQFRRLEKKLSALPNLCSSAVDRNLLKTELLNFLYLQQNNFRFSLGARPKLSGSRNMNNRSVVLKMAARGMNRARIFKLLRSPGINSSFLWSSGGLVQQIGLSYTGTPGYIDWRNRFLGIDSWAP